MADMPRNLRYLTGEVERLANERGIAMLRLRTLVANEVVAQMLPEGIVKGGTSIKFRYGDAATRFTRDLDAARVSDETTFVAKLERSLADGWGPFTATVAPGEPREIDGLDPAYVMHPYDIKLSYRGRQWCTVPLEVGHDEIGDADEPEWRAPTEEVLGVFSRLGLPEPGPVPVMPVRFQVAQKLHAVSTPGGHRAHDLVDLQLIAANERLDLAVLRATCERLFSYRQQQAWPPTITAGPGWADVYDSQSDGLNVIDGVDAATNWANALIRDIASAQ